MKTSVKIQATHFYYKNIFTRLWPILKRKYVFGFSKRASRIADYKEHTNKDHHKL